MYDFFLFFVLYFQFSSEKTEKPLKGVKSQKKEKGQDKKHTWKKISCEKREFVGYTFLQNQGMVTEKSCDLLE